MIKRISLVCTLTQTRMEEGKVTFPSMELRKGKMCLPCDKSQSFYIYVYLPFLEASHLISLKCACLAVCNVHAFCLKQECVLGSVMLPNMGPLRDQHIIFVMVKFLCVRFSSSYSVVYQETLCLISLNDYMYISFECTFVSN